MIAATVITIVTLDILGNDEIFDGDLEDGVGTGGFFRMILSKPYLAKPKCSLLIQTKHGVCSLFRKYGSYWEIIR